MSNNTIPPIDLERENMIHYLRRLTQGLLDINGAQELIPLLQKWLKTAKEKGDVENINRLSYMINSLNLYIEGKINLYSGIADDMRLSNID